jgi:phospholipase C
MPAWGSPSGHRLVLPPGTRPDPTKPEGADLLPEIEHIVIYMQENHSYDNYLGMLSRGDGFTLVGGVPTNTNPDGKGGQATVFKATQTCDVLDGASQSWNSSHLSWNNGGMDGFVTAAGGATGSMEYYDGTQLPFYHGLANTFPVCDRWFCSVLAQTFPNRRYLQAATSLGIVSTDISEVLATPDAPNGLIWDRLNAHGITWNDYAIDLADILLFPNFYGANTSHVQTFHQFHLDCANGTLPQVSIISPGNTTYSEEAPADLQLGEAYSASIINSVLQSPLWSKTAMFFMYDEHGGYYDHVPPPAAPAPDSIAPRITVPPDQPGAFDRLGMRVPAFIISPFAKADYVSSVVHDHTSVLKFIETKFNLGALTFRDANADNLLDSFDFAHPGFMDPPVLPAPGLPVGGNACNPHPDVPPPEPPIPTTTTTTTSTSTTTTSTTAPSSSTSVAGSSTSAAGATSTTSSGVAAATATTNGAGGPTSSATALARTGAKLDDLTKLGGVAALAGIAAVLAARERHERERVVVSPDALSFDDPDTE